LHIQRRKFMPGLLIKELPPGLHSKLKKQAQAHHRSMTREALAILEISLSREKAPYIPPPPVKGAVPITQKWLDKTIREGRS
jgi:plasmid stability protein